MDLSRIGLPRTLSLKYWRIVRQSLRPNVPVWKRGFELNLWPRAARSDVGVSKDPTTCVANIQESDNTGGGVFKGKRTNEFNSRRPTALRTFTKGALCFWSFSVNARTHFANFTGTRTCCFVTSLPPALSTVDKTTCSMAGMMLQLDKGMTKLLASHGLSFHNLAKKPHTLKIHRWFGSTGWSGDHTFTLLCPKCCSESVPFKCCAKA